MKVVLNILFLAFSFLSYSQTYTPVDEEILVEKLSTLRSSTTNVDLKAKNDTFKKYLLVELEKSEALKYPFNNLPSIGKLTSDDKQVRVFSWNIQLEDETNVYSAFVLKYDKRKKKHIVTELIKDEWGPRPDLSSTLDKNQWYGCVYYDIIDVKKGSKTYYTLLGYDAKNGLTHIKLVDVLYFAGNNPKLGYNLFKTEKGVEKRIFMEHAKKAVMTLRFDEMRDKIVYDHLSPESPNLKEFREYWVPDMSYDAMSFTNGKWIVEEDIIAINENKEEKFTVQTFDEKEGVVKEVEIKNTWETPGDINAPIDGGGHTAIVPEEYTDDKNKKKKAEKEKKVKKEKEEKYNGVSFNNLGKKKKKKRRK